MKPAEVARVLATLEGALPQGRRGDSAQHATFAGWLSGRDYETAMTAASVLAENAEWFPSLAQFRIAYDTEVRRRRPPALTEGSAEPAPADTVAARLADLRRVVAGAVKQVAKVDALPGESRTRPATNFRPAPCALDDHSRCGSGPIRPHQ